MAKDTYWLIETDEDGDVSCHNLTKEMLLADIEEQDREYKEGSRLSDILTDNPTQNLQDKRQAFVIKGHIVLPKAVTKTVTWDLE